MLSRREPTNRSTNEQPPKPKQPVLIKKVQLIKKVVKTPIPSRGATVYHQGPSNQQSNPRPQVQLNNKRTHKSTQQSVNKRLKSSPESAQLSDSSDDSPPKNSALDSRGSTPNLLIRQGIVVERDASIEKEGNVPHISAYDMVFSNKGAYKHWFVDPNRPQATPFQWCGSKIPIVNIEYPNNNATEKFALVYPNVKDNDEYNPIDDLLSTIRLILDNFLTPEQALDTFNHSSTTFSPFAFLDAPKSRSSTPASPSSSTEDTTPLIRALEKAKAKKDGPAFFKAIERYNSGMRKLKAEGIIKQNIKDMKGVKDKIWMKIVDQVYERVVGPEIEKLKEYEAFSDNVYGELLPRFMNQIFQQTSLGPDSVFVDLGSGVGNCVIQAAIATGCDAYGFENMPHASSLAQRQLKEARARCRLWGIKSGRMTVTEADFCACDKVNEVLGGCNVVLVNNEVFSSSLNERLSLLFLDLPNGAQIVSLKAFASNFTLSIHNQHSPLAILDQGKEYTFPRNSVSWKDEGGVFSIAKVDRSILSRFQEDQEKRKE